VHPNPPVVFDESQLPEAIHEEAHPGARCSDHVGQRFLRDLWNEHFGFAWLAELSHQQQDAG